MATKQAATKLASRVTAAATKRAVSTMSHTTTPTLHNNLLLVGRGIASKNSSSNCNSFSQQRLVVSSKSNGSSKPHGRWFSSNSNNNNAEPKEKEPADTSAEEPQTTEEPAASETEAEEATETKPNKEEELQQEVKSLKDQLLRSLAEQENIRNIARRDVSAAKQFAIKSFAKSLLEVSDNLTRAMDHVSLEEMESNASLKTLFDGIEMTNTGLTKALESHGVKKFCDKPGDVFDPELMNALMEYPDPSKEPGTVGQVIKVGFTLNNRVLRPAEVGVIKKP